MPKVFKVTARKDYPAYGIKKGDEHYTWTVKTGPRSSKDWRSLTPPKQSQLTGSSYKQEAFAINEEIEAATATCMDDVRSLRDDMKGRAESLRDETQERFDAMPESLQSGPTGELLSNRVEALDAFISELEDLELDDDWEAAEPEDGAEPTDDPINDEDLTESEFLEAALDAVKEVTLDVE